MAKVSRAATPKEANLILTREGGVRMLMANVKIKSKIPTGNIDDGGGARGKCAEQMGDCLRAPGCRMGMPFEEDEDSVGCLWSTTFIFWFTS